MNEGEEEALMLGHRGQEELHVDRDVNEEKGEAKHYQTTTV